MDGASEKLDLDNSTKPSELQEKIAMEILNCLEWGIKDTLWSSANSNIINQFMSEFRDAIPSVMHLLTYNAFINLSWNFVIWTSLWTIFYNEDGSMGVRSLEGEEIATFKWHEVTEYITNYIEYLKRQQ